MMRDDLEYVDDELELAIVVEVDGWEILGVHAFDQKGEQVDLSDQK